MSVFLYDPLVLILATEERFCFGSFTLVRACASAAAPYLISSSAVLVKMLSDDKRVSSKKEHLQVVWGEGFAASGQLWVAHF